MFLKLVKSLSVGGGVSNQLLLTTLEVVQLSDFDIMTKFSGVVNSIIFSNPHELAENKMHAKLKLEFHFILLDGS